MKIMLYRWQLLHGPKKSCVKPQSSHQCEPLSKVTLSSLRTQTKSASSLGSAKATDLDHHSSSKLSIKRKLRIKMTKEVLVEGERVVPEM